ncbi:hypothetical protein VCHE48_0602 [Vibrio cholerae HE48]|nr:hypothetical protein VCHE48_0602 [Vibrio cholerae HE48]
MINETMFRIKQKIYVIKVEISVYFYKQIKYRLVTTHESEKT